jgi:hypothetical protein
MNDKQIWQTIALDLKRAAILLSNKRDTQAKYFLDEAKQLFETRKEEEKKRIAREFVCFKGHSEDILLGSSIILGRI